MPHLAQGIQIAHLQRRDSKVQANGVTAGSNLFMLRLGLDCFRDLPGKPFAVAVLGDGAELAR